MCHPRVQRRAGTQCQWEPGGCLQKSSNKEVRQNDSFLLPVGIQEAQMGWLAAASHETQSGGCSRLPEMGIMMQTTHDIQKVCPWCVCSADCEIIRAKRGITVATLDYCTLTLRKVLVKICTSEGVGEDFQGPG